MRKSVILAMSAVTSATSPASPTQLRRLNRMPTCVVFRRFSINIIIKSFSRVVLVPFTRTESARANKYRHLDDVLVRRTGTSLLGVFT